MVGDWIGAVGACVSIVALWIVVHDRRVRLSARLRGGRWIIQEADKLYGVVEVYNRSMRANAISSYRYLARNSHGDWIELESERYEFEGRGVHNASPLVIAPYSGAEVQFACFGEWRNFPKTLEIKLHIMDVFGDPYPIDIKIPNRYAETQ